MRQETKQNKRFKRNISYILIMALCIVSLSCGVCEADEAWIWNNAPSAEYINTDETNYGKITQNRDGTYYKLYRLDGRVADDYLFGYYSVKLHILTKLD